MLFLYLFVNAFLVVANDETLSYPTSDVTKIVVMNQSGNIKISGDATANVIVNIEKVSFQKHCSLTNKVDGKVLTIEVAGSAGLFNKNCDVNFSVNAPKNISVDLMSVDGNVIINGIAGDVKLMTGHGNISVDGEVRDVKVSTGSGNIAIKGMTAGGAIKTGSGNIKIDYLTEPKEGNLDLKTGSGNAMISLPKTTKMDASFTAGSGGFKNDFTNFPESSFKISVVTGSGNLAIKKL